MIFNYLLRQNFITKILFREGIKCNNKIGGESIAKRSIFSNSSAYDGDGKTTVRVLNDEELNLNVINSYSNRGFRLANGLFIVGPILLFPTHIYSWNVKCGKDITLDSLLLFDLIVPKVKIVVIGYGQNGESHDPSLPNKLRKKGISCEMLPTPNAVTTYNYLLHDAVHVAGAFLPVRDEVTMNAYDVRNLREHDKLTKSGDYVRPWVEKEPISYYEERWEELRKDEGKKKFED